MHTIINGKQFQVKPTGPPVFLLVASRRPLVACQGRCGPALNGKMTMSQDANNDFDLNANGPAYTSGEHRHGVPMSYVGEKLGSAIEELHRYALCHPEARDDLQAPMYYLLVAHLGLHNMLGKANDRSLTKRLLHGGAEELQTWLRLIEREGDVEGLAGLYHPRGAG